MKRFFVTTLFVLLSVVVGAQASAFRGYTYDSRSGNHYSTFGSGYRGYNFNTGSMWSTYNSGRSMYGIDSRGNYWNYDRNSGFYQNFGTGEMRYRGNRW